jgi:hypothetical protein
LDCGAIIVYAREIYAAGYAFRDDRKAGIREDETYSLFGTDDRGMVRVAVYGGPFSWAVTEAHKEFIDAS